MHAQQKSNAKQQPARKGTQSKKKQDMQKAGKKNEEMLCIYESQIEVKPEALSLGLQDGQQNSEIKLQPSQQDAHEMGEDDTIGLMVGGDANRGVVND